MAKVQAKKKPGNKFFSRINYQFQRGIRELLSEKELSHKEWLEILECFNNRCAFCGILDNKNPRTGLIPDHLTPTTENGEMCIGNIVPSCHECNDRRGSKYWIDYINASDYDDKESKISRIKQYLKKYPYTPPKELSTLTDEEANEYREIIKEWEFIWQRLRKLRDEIKDRRKNGI